MVLWSYQSAWHNQEYNNIVLVGHFLGAKISLKIKATARFQVDNEKIIKIYVHDKLNQEAILANSR